MVRRAGRPKAGQERLTRERIVAAALDLVDGGGREALSMRRQAAALGVDPMAIYHHLPGKEALVAALIEAVFAGVQRLPADAPWQERVRAFAHAYRGVVRAHPHLVAAVVANAEVAGAATIEASEGLYAALVESGLPPRMVVRAADLVVDYVHGFALAEVEGGVERPEARRPLTELLAIAPADAFPAMRRVFGALTEEEAQPDFAFGVDVIVAGLEALIAESRSVEAGRPL